MTELSIKNLRFKYGIKGLLSLLRRGSDIDGENILKGINLELKEGLNVLLGPNGTGKTTLMKILGTFFDYNSGEIYLDKLNYKKDISEIRNNIAYLPQNFKVYPTISGREFLELMAGLRKVSDSTNVIDQIIKNLEMEEYIDKRIGKYSGGMNQKLGIAQLLVGNPKLMIIDEPTVGLDPEQRNIIRETLNEISSNRIVLVSTHIVEDIEVNCDNLIIMKKGRVLYEGGKDELLNLYKGKVYKAIITTKELKIFKQGNLIISKKIIDKNWEVKYYSEEDESQEKIDINLEEAYIICQNL